MTAHRGWLVVLYQAPGAGLPGLAAWDMRASVGGAAIATTGGTAAVSSTSSGSAAALFDGNPATEWIGGVAAPYGYYLFPAPVDVVEIALRMPANASNVPQAVALHYSDDGARWTGLGPFVITEGAAPGAVLVASGFSEPRSGRSVAAARVALGPLFTSPVRSYAARGKRPTYDPIDGGPYRVAGDVAIDGAPATPVQRRVRLLERKTARLVREAWSDPVTGAFAFERIAMNEYIVLTDDYTRYFNAVVADAVVPVP